MSINQTIISHASGSAVALIVGGSSGIGLETARLLRTRGLDLILLSSNQEKLTKAKVNLESAPGGGVDLRVVDLNNATDVDAVVGTAALRAERVRKLEAGKGGAGPPAHAHDA